MDTIMKTYTEEEINTMTTQQLKDICSDIAVKYNTPLENIVPYGANRDCIISSILESQEESGRQ